jgi:hypothetical protein
MDAEYASQRHRETVVQSLGTKGVSGTVPRVVGGNCVVHGIAHTHDCRRCKREGEVKEVLEHLERDGLMADVKQLSTPNRKVAVVAMRKSLIKRLHDGYGLSFVQIGKLLGRDHSSVLHLYYKKN